MKPLEEETYYQHTMRKISLHDTTPDFPKLEDYGLDKSTVESYLSDKQDILDIAGSTTHRLTQTGGIILVIMLISSAFDHIDTPLGNKASLVGLALGIALSSLWYLLVNMRISHKLKTLRDDNIESYLKAVEDY